MLNVFKLNPFNLLIWIVEVVKGDRTLFVNGSGSEEIQAASFSRRASRRCSGPLLYVGDRGDLFITNLQNSAARRLTTEIIDTPPSPTRNVSIHVASSAVCVGSVCSGRAYHIFAPPVSL